MRGFYRIESDTLLGCNPNAQHTARTKTLNLLSLLFGLLLTLEHTKLEEDYWDLFDEKVTFLVVIMMEMDFLLYINTKTQFRERLSAVVGMA